MLNLKSEVLKFVAGAETYTFNELALEIYKKQSCENETYRQFLHLIGRADMIPRTLEDIPLMPISFFKSHEVKTGKWKEENIFLSSGTESVNKRSKHFVREEDVYNQISISIFKDFYRYGNYNVVALLPSYLENKNSSLVHMVRQLMKNFNKSDIDFYLDDFAALYSRLEECKAESLRTTILVGVSFALIDFARIYKLRDPNLRIVFTGGMKNRKKEMSFEEVFDLLQASFPESKIDAEYGMTELFSQAYCQNERDGFYTPGKSLKVLPKELNDPFCSSRVLKAGQLGYVDLANFETISFVMTDDLCITREDGTFKLLGRISESDLRGCNLLYQI